MIVVKKQVENMKLSSKRNLTPYEKTQLAKYQIPLGKALNQPDLPIEYLTGWVDFAGLTLKIDQRALIPRVETEELVTLATQYIFENPKKQDQCWQIADIGTGCGAMALAIAHNLAPAKQAFKILATDISTEALELAKLNAQQLKLTESIEFKQLDLLTKLPANYQVFDLITANLPYIPTGRITQLDKSVGAYEPLVALDGGPEGFSLIEKFLNQAESKIKPTGLILLEIDYSHPDLLKNKFCHAWQIKTWTSQQSRCIFAQLRKKITLA